MANTVLDTVLADAAEAATAAATLTANPIAGGVAAALGVAEDVNASINDAQKAHASTLGTVSAGITKLTTDPNTVTAIKALPAADQATATGLLAMLTKGWTAFESLF